MANSITWAIRRFLRLDGRNDREKRDRHVGGSPYMPSLLGLPCARAPRPSAATCGPGQPVPGSCPASPSAAAGLAVPPAITLQSLRRRHRRQFCSPQPWQLRARASSIRRRRHLTPRAGQRHQPLTARPNRPSLAPSPPAPPIRSHLSSSANAAAAPRQRPGRLADLQPAMPPPPHRLGSTSSTSRLEPGGHVGLDHCFSTSHGDNSVFQEPILRPS